LLVAVLLLNFQVLVFGLNPWPQIDFFFSFFVESHADVTVGKVLLIAC